MEKKPLSVDVEINVDDEKLNRAIEKTDRLIESLREANRLIREINEIEPNKIMNTLAGKDEQ